MIRELFPRTHDRYLSLPLLGPLADDLAQWLRDEGYARPTRRQFLRAVVPIDRALRRRGLNRINALAWRDVVACWNWYRRRNARVAGTVHVLQRFLTHRGLLGPPASTRPTRTGARLAAYATYLRDVRGLDPATIHQHVVTAEEFLRHVKYETYPTRLAALSARDLEAPRRSREVDRLCSGGVTQGRNAREGVDSERDQEGNEVIARCSRGVDQL
jgi:hypothetical protein